MPFIQTPNLRIHYRVAGTGNVPLLLLHGNFGSWRWWQPLLQQVPAGYRAYVPDLRGCGDSERPGYGHNIETLAADAQAFAKALDFIPEHIVGHSLGAAVALQLALEQPAQVRSLTLVAPPPAEGRSVVRNADWFSHSVSQLFDVDQDASVVTLGATYRMLRHLGANRPMLRQALMRLAPTLDYDNAFIELVSDAARMAPQAVVGHLQALDAWDVQTRLRSLRLPVLIVGGQQDVLVAADDLRDFARRLPRGRLIIWADVGHAVQLEQPRRFVSVLFRFLERARKPWWQRWYQPLR
jgi:branched-chain amino acid transport system permease protein